VYQILDVPVWLWGHHIFEAYTLRGYRAPLCEMLLYAHQGTCGPTPFIWQNYLHQLEESSIVWWLKLPEPLLKSKEKTELLRIEEPPDMQ
jgi:hypothetical protein